MLVGYGMPEYEAKRYEGRVKKGGILLSVHCDSSDWIKRAKDTLQETGAEDISSTGEASADYAKSDKPLPRGSEAAATRDYPATDADIRRRELNKDYVDTDRPLRKTGTDY